MLKEENASLKVSGVFYKAIVQGVLLFGSETWKLSPASIKSLEGFHLRAALCMVGMHPTQTPNRTLTYPSSKNELKAVGLKVINHHIRVC